MDGSRPQRLKAATQAVDFQQRWLVLGAVLIPQVAMHDDRPLLLAPEQGYLQDIAVTSCAAMRSDMAQP